MKRAVCGVVVFIIVAGLVATHPGQPGGPVYTVDTIVSGLHQQPTVWAGRTILVRGAIIWYDAWYWDPQQQSFGEDDCTDDRYPTVSACQRSIAWDLAHLQPGSTVRLVRMLVAWRRVAARPYLALGRVEKPYPVEAPGGAVLTREVRPRLAWLAVLTSRWTAPDGRRAQVLVNYTEAAVDYALDTSTADIGSVAVVDDPARGHHAVGPVSEGRLRVALAPLSVVLVEFNEDYS